MLKQNQRRGITHNNCSLCGSEDTETEDFNFCNCCGQFFDDDETKESCNERPSKTTGRSIEDHQSDREKLNRATSHYQ